MGSEKSRRDFLLGTGLAAAGGLLQASARPAAAQTPSTSYLAPEGFAAAPVERPRIAFVGVGGQGGGHVRNFLRIQEIDIAAICDIDEPRAREVASWVSETGRAKPDLYTRGETDFRRLCERDDVDLVFNSTPWRWHVPICVEAMTSGKHTAVEVPAATTLEGCWQLVETAEAQERHCVMMENCCYGRREMMILNMVRGGLLGELTHAEAAYIHDLRELKFSDSGEGTWRLAHSESRDANLYPTHGLGPVAQCLDINRGDQFHYLVSMSSPARGLELYGEEHLPERHPRRRSYALGDMNTSLIKTRRGCSILLQHDTTTPRPYSRINLVQGTRGAVTGYPDRAYIEGLTEGHDWQDLSDLSDRWEHPLWRQLEERSRGAGHGGMDFLEDWRLVECLRRGEPMDMDVYDAAAWSAVTDLSEISVAQGSRPVEFPDFTRGRWPERHPLGIVS
jgi:hypothetical protein